MARPTKYDQDRADRIVERLRAGCTRRAAAISAGISEDTFARWLERYADFAELVGTAEAEAEVRNTAILQKAAQGWDAGKTVRTTKTIYRKQKSVTISPDGSRVVAEEWIPLEEVTEFTEDVREFDWRAALEWLKRRRPRDWGDRTNIRFEQMDDDEIVEYLLRAAAVAPA